VISFESAEAFRAELDTYLSKGALRTAGDDLPDPLTEFDFTLRPPGSDAGVSLRGMIVSTTGDAVLIQILGFDASVVSRLEEATGGEDDGFVEAYQKRHQVSGVFVAGAPQKLDGLSGQLRNPPALADLHTLPLGPVAGVPELQRVNTVGLLRYLGSRRANGCLTISLPDHADRALPMQGGYFMLTKRDLESPNEWMFAPEGTYAFSTADQSVRPAAKRLSPRQLVARGVRHRIRVASIEEVRALVDPELGVRLTAAYAERSHALELTDSDKRLIKRQFDGSRRVADMTHSGQGERKVLRLVLMLEVMALAELVDVVSSTSAEQRDPVRDEYERLVQSDLFAALGLHWTSSPRLLDQKLEEVREAFGPSSGAYGASPDFAGKRLELAERAYERLATKGGRRAYRSEVLKVDVEAAAETIAQNVLVLKYRGDIQEAIERIHAALDLVDKKKYRDLLLKLELG
jgi:hypothetical protein